MKFGKTLTSVTAIMIAALAAWAGDTKRFEVKTFDDFRKGEAAGVAVRSDGALVPMGSLDQHKLEADGVWALADAGLGKVLLGTGNKGRLYEYKMGSMKLAYDTGRVAVTDIERDGDGSLWFAAMPNSAVFVMDRGGDVREAFKVGEDYAWDILLDGRDVVAATGPSGKVIRFSREGKVKSTVETGEKHVMCLVKGGDGRLYAGTAGDGLVLVIEDGGYRVLHDFDEEEVRDLVWWGGKDGQLVAALNTEGKGGPSKAAISKAIRSEAKKGNGEGGNGKGGDEQGGGVSIDAGPTSPGGGRIDSGVYALTGAGSARELLAMPKRAAVALAVMDGYVYVTTDQEGKVYRCRPDRPGYAIAFDLEPAQALAIMPEGDDLWVGTGSPAALVKVSRKLMDKPAYTSEVFDAGFPAAWGEMDWSADGKVMIKTRSGNIKDPKRGWSDWKMAGGMTRPAPVTSPDARYLQVKIEWPLGLKAEVREISIPYAVHNQPHFIDGIKVDGDDDKGRKSRRSRKSDDGGPGEHSAKLKITWDVTNPDDDRLLYELHFQPEDARGWVKIRTAEPITKTEHEWDTASLPDGRYRVKVSASDKRSRGADHALTAELASEFFAVDNTAPEVELKKWMDGGIRGKVTDKVSYIDGIEYSVDGGEWRTVEAKDGILDSRREEFSFELPGDLAEGPHFIAVRAWDVRDNLGAGQVLINK